MAMACFVTDEQEPVKAYPHQELMAFVLERDWLGHTVINAPPGTSKTWWGGNFFCSQRLGLNPSLRILYISVSAAHSLKQSTNIRDVIEGNPAFRALYPKCLPNKKRGWGEVEWYLQRPGNDPNPTFLAAGVDTGILGARADLIIFDDVNSEKQQRSPTQRANVTAWCANTAQSRLVPGGRMLNIQTRWHESDLTGWCIDEHWTRLHFKALIDNDEELQFARLTVYTREQKNRLALELLQEGWDFSVEEAGDDGEKNDHRWIFKITLHANGPALWPERISAAHYMKRRLSDGPTVWSCVYQGEPAPTEGNIIPVENFQYYVSRSQDFHPMAWLKKIQAWDTASTNKNYSDYSVCTTWGLARDGTYWLLDLFRKKIPFPELKREVNNQYLKHQPNEILVEAASSGIQLLQELRQSSDFTYGRLPVVSIRPTELGRDKVEKTSTVTGYVDAKRVYIPSDVPWLQDFLNELTLFPNANHDDMVDSFTLGLWRLSKSSFQQPNEENWMLGERTDGGSSPLTWDF